METSFVATYGSGRPRVGIIAEDDALPKLGHACGHNLIASWAIGAGVALKEALPEFQGTIKVIGTPAEEGGGGKVTMAEAGAFRGLGAAMMMHGRDTTYLDRGSLAVTPHTVEFFRPSAHASAADIFAIKLIKTSGLTHARAIGALAAAHRIGILVISPYETEIGCAASLALALSAPTSTYANGLGVRSIPELTTLRWTAPTVKRQVPLA